VIVRRALTAQPTPEPDIEDMPSDSRFQPNRRDLFQLAAAAEFWGRLFNVDVTWFDPELSAAKQLAVVEEMASKKWDFVAIQAVDIDTITDPLVRLIEAGIQLWEGYLAKFPKIDAALFHNDDMALAAASVMEAHGRTGILIGGIDAMPAAIEAVVDGRMHATVRNSSCRIHGGAIVAGVAAARGSDPGTIPKQVVIDGPIVTKANAPGMLWMEEQFLI
jgi:ABC-type sugar transport system substrate-binding protein